MRGVRMGAGGARLGTGAVEEVAVVGAIALIDMAVGKATGLAVMAVNKV